MSSSPVEPTPEPSPETLKFLFEFVKDAPDKQLEAQENLDNKTIQVFVAAGVIIGLSGLSGLPAKGAVSASLLVAALIAFLVVAGVAGWALWSRKFRVLLHTDKLWEKHRTKTPDRLRRMMIKEAAAAYTCNRELIRLKSKLLRSALIATAVEVALVGTLFIWTAARPAPASQDQVHPRRHHQAAAGRLVPAARVFPIRSHGDPNSLAR